MHTPKVRCKCDPYSHGHRENMQTQHSKHCFTWGFEPETTVPPVNAVACFIISVIDFVATSGQWSCAVSTKLQSVYI